MTNKNNGLKKILLVTHHRRFKTVLRSVPMARELAKRGYDLTLMCIADQERFRLKEYREDGILMVETPDLLPGKLRSGWDVWNQLRRKKYLRDKKFDLVHAFETRPATIYPVKSYLKKTPTPLVIDWIDWWGRGGLISELRPKWYQFLFGGLETYYEEHFRKEGDALTVICQGLADRAVGLGVDQNIIHKIQGGAEPDLFTPQDRSTHRSRFGIPHEAPVLGFSAADVTMDAGLVLQVLQKVRLECPNALLLMTGNKPADFDRLVQDYNVQKSVHHLGFLPYEDLPHALSCVDVFLLPFPNKPANIGRWPHKISDYMCLGRPTVTNPVGEMKILFEEYDIGLLAEENPEDFSAKAVYLLKNPALALEKGTIGRNVAENQFTWKKVVDRLEQVYIEVFNRFHAGVGVSV